jgi:predicted aconitase with swiveling domain
MKIGLWIGTIISVSAYSSVLAHAQTSGLNGLDPNRTGRIATVPVAHEGATIAPAVLRQSQEAPVAPAAIVALAPPAPGVIDDKLLAGEIATRFEPLALCRIDVARSKQVRVEEVAADRLTLRWTIDPNGKATTTQVVATTPVDADVLHCVKQQMLGWTFSRPSGGPLPVERVYQFRSAQAAPLQTAR